MIKTTLTMSTIELITGIIAIYGAGLSTLIFFKEQQKTKRQLKIRLNFGFLTFTQGLSEQMVLIEIINPGLKPVTINGPQLRLPDRRSLIMPVPNSNVKFPCELGEGKSVHVWIEEMELKSKLLELGFKESIKLTAVVLDQTGKEFHSKGFLNFKIK